MFTSINYVGVEKTARARSVPRLLVIATLLVVASAAGLDDYRLTRAFPTHVATGRSPGCSKAERCCSSPSPATPASPHSARKSPIPAHDPARHPDRVWRSPLLIYGIVIAAALIALGPDGLARSSAPLVSTVEAAGFDALAPVVRIGAAVASLSVLLSLLAGVSRTMFAMARERDLPRGSTPSTRAIASRTTPRSSAG